MALAMVQLLRTVGLQLLLHPDLLYDWLLLLQALPCLQELAKVLQLRAHPHHDPQEGPHRPHPQDPPRPQELQEELQEDPEELQEQPP